MLVEFFDFMESSLFSRMIVKVCPPVKKIPKDGREVEISYDLDQILRY